MTSIGYDAFNRLSTLIIEEGEKALRMTVYYGSKDYPLNNLTQLIAKRDITFNVENRHYNSVFPNVTDIYIDNFQLNRNRICNKLQKLTLGKNATVEKDLSLIKLENLECITLEDPTATITCPSFTNKQFTDIILYVPEGSLTAYQNADGWKNFWDIREISTSGIRDAIPDKEVQETGRYNLHGQPVTDDYRGFVIVRYSDGTIRKTIK